MKFLDMQSCRKYMTKGVIPASKATHGSMFIGDKGWINVFRGGWEFSSDDIRKHARDQMKINLPISNDHRLNFIDAIGGSCTTVSDLDSAVRSDIVCHLSNIAVRTRREVKWDNQLESIVDDTEQKSMMKRESRAGYNMI
ncbi:MAG: hypothetical protein PHO37_15715 [Kiritimatiellae bacterium]|nr:hypothetical protein [Kiritimatiellia bacterium]